MLWIRDKGSRRCLLIFIFIDVCCLWAVSGFSDGSKLAKGTATTRALYCNRKPSRRDPLHFDPNCKGYCAPRRDFEQFYTLTVSNTTYWLDVIWVNITAKPGSGKAVTGFSLYAIDESDHVAGIFVEDDTNVIVGSCNDLIAVTDETHAAFHKMADHGRKNISIQWQPDGYNHGRVKFVLWVVNNHSDVYFMESQWLTSQKDGSNTLDVRMTLDKIVSAIDIDIFEKSFKYRSTKGYNLDLANPFSAFDRSPSKNDFVPANITGSNRGSNVVSGNSSLVISQPGGSGTNGSSTLEVAASNATSGMHDASVLGNNMNATKVNNVNNTVMLNASENKLNTVNDTKLNNLSETNMDTLNDTNLNTMNQTNMGNLNDTNLNTMNQTNMGNVNNTNLNTMNQTNMGNVNNTNLNTMNQTNMGNLNDTNLNTMNQTNMGNVNNTNLNTMNQTNMGNLNDTNLNTMNQTNMGNLNDTNLNTMNQTSMGNVNDTNLNTMNQTNMFNLNDTNLNTMNQTNMGNVNNTNLNTMNQTNMGNLNDTNLNTMNQTNMGIVNDTNRYDMNQTNMGNVNDTNPYNVNQTNMNNINDATVKNVTLTPANNGSQTTQLDSTINQNIPYPSQIPFVGTSGSQPEKTSNNAPVNTAITPISTTSYPQLRDSQTTALGDNNMYTTTIAVPDPKPSGSQDVAAPGNKRILNTSGNTNSVTPSPGSNVSDRTITNGNDGFSTIAYPGNPASNRADISTTPRVASENPSSTIADAFRPVAA